MSTRSKIPISLILGDVIVVLLVTVVGFESHNRLSAGMVRMLATFIPVLVSWVLIGVHVGVFDPARAADPRQLWRPLWAMVLAGPFAGWMRGLLLGTSVPPIFVIILGGISALALLAWRTLYWFLTRKR